MAETLREKKQEDDKGEEDVDKHVGCMPIEKKRKLEEEEEDKIVEDVKKKTTTAEDDKFIEWVLSRHIPEMEVTTASSPDPTGLYLYMFAGKEKVEEHPKGPLYAKARHIAKKCVQQKTKSVEVNSLVIPELALEFDVDHSVARSTFWQALDELDDPKEDEDEDEDEEGDDDEEEEEEEEDEEEEAAAAAA